MWVLVIAVVGSGYNLKEYSKPMTFQECELAVKAAKHYSINGATSDTQLITSVYCIKK